LGGKNAASEFIPTPVGFALRRAVLSTSAATLRTSPLAPLPSGSVGGAP
jgi:hypothetical protein